MYKLSIYVFITPRASMAARSRIDRGQSPIDRKSEEIGKSGKSGSDSNYHNARFRRSDRLCHCGISVLPSKCVPILFSFLTPKVPGVNVSRSVEVRNTSRSIANNDLSTLGWSVFIGKSTPTRFTGLFPFGLLPHRLVQQGQALDFLTGAARRAHRKARLGVKLGQHQHRHFVNQAVQR